MPQPINELHTNLLGKVLFVAIGAWLVGRATNLAIRGSRSDVQVVVDAMLASKRFQDELKRPNATVQSVMDKLNLKHASVAEFERVLGIKWPL